MDERSGINLIGHMSTNLGLGVAARNTARLLEDCGHPFAAIDIPTASMPHRADLTWESRFHDPRTPLPFAVNLFHMNPPEIAAEIRLKPAWLESQTTWNALVPFWELPQLPDNWLPVIGRMDTVLAPTQFVADVVRRSAPDVDVVHFPQTVYLPDGITPDRAAWGLADDATVYVFSFDLNSDPARKNPWGAIEAYRVARSEMGDATTKLVIRANNATTAMGKRHLSELHAAASADPTIVIVDKALTYREVLSLYASADAFVSLHRAEGLGLGLLESMMLGTPAIATAYSGNMDFMNEENSLMVDYTLVPAIGADRGSYAAHKIGGEQVWAEPNIEMAAAHMARLARDPALRRRLSEVAAESARATQSSAERYAAINHLLERAAASPRASRLAELQSGHALIWRARRIVGTQLRQLGLR
ncbi:MAG: glycosyltransferase family 4 protein [Coriobacteriia bacterium]